MRAKWFIIALILVVLPAAILSILAARAIGYHELIMRAQQRQDAERILSAVDSAVHDRMLHSLELVTLTLAGGLKPAMGTEQLDPLARRLVREHACITEVLVFMNPWGFLINYPAPDNDNAAVLNDLVANELRTRIATASSSAQTHNQNGSVTNDSVGAPLHFLLNQHTYYFSHMPGTASVWAGYAADRPALTALLRESLDEHAGEGMVLSYAGEPVRDPLADVADVVVSDSLSPGNRAEGQAREHGIPGLPVIASRFLMPPLDGIEILAQAAPGVQIRQIALAKTRLYGWGLAVVVAWVLVGIGVVLRQGIVEIHQARQRGEFLLGVSHDLRTPLASMRMLAESLAQGHVRAKEQPRFLNTIVEECDRLARLIERVLYLVRYGQGALVYCRREVDVGEVVRKTVSELKAYANSLQVRIAPELPPVQGDRAALEQVALNLLDNAVKYGKKVENGEGEDSPVRVEVEVASVVRRRRRWRREARWVCLTVRDFGMGIEKREHRKIFRRFYRSPRAHDRNVSGVGLGLALCNHVVRNHGGWIDVESELGKGTTFRVYLKCGQGGTDG